MGGSDAGDESPERVAALETRLTDRLLTAGKVTPEGIEECRRTQSNLQEQGRPSSLAQILLANRMISNTDLDVVLAELLSEELPALGIPPEAAAVPDSERFGKFIRVQLLGSGGMGDVWKSWDTSLGRWVALKFLKGGDRADVARLLREAQTAGRLSHAGIVAVHEVGTERGEHYIAMQYVEGQTLETYPRHDRKSLVRLLRDAARAVALAHREGVVHRDLKPSNLMVAERPGAGPQVYVADFGLARSMTDPGGLSQSGVLMGTPDYMSPEQARGDSVDGRTDVWSLGATLYELTTDRLPFRGANMVAVLKRIMEDEPKRPRRIQPRISSDLETIILKCLEKDPARRYATADDLADDLDRFLAGDPIHARPPTVWNRLLKKLAKRKALTAVAAAGVLVALALGGRLWSVNEEARRREAVLTEIGALWSRMVEAKQGLNHQPVDLAREAPMVRRRILDVIDDVGKFVERNPRLPQGYYIRARGRLYLEDLTKAEEDLRKSIEVEPAFAPGHAQLGKVLMQRHVLFLLFTREDSQHLRGLAQLAARMGDPVLLLKEAREELARAGAAAPSNRSWGLTRTREDEVSDTLLEAARLYYVESKIDEAVALLRSANERDPSEEYMHWLGRAASTNEEKIEWHSRAIARRPFYAAAYLDRAFVKLYQRAAHENESMTLEERDRIQEAFLEDAETALRINPELGVLKPMFANIHQELGNPEKALAHLDDWFHRDSGGSSEIEEDGDYDLFILGVLRTEVRDYEGSIRVFDQLLKKHPGHSFYVFFRGSARYLKGDAGASEDFEAAIRQSPDYLVQRGQLYWHTGSPDQAKADFRKYLDLGAPTPFYRKMAEEGIKWLERGVPFEPSSLFETSYRHHRRRRYEKAIEGFSKIVEMMPKTEYGWMSAYNIACARAILGQRDAALDWLEKAVQMGFARIDHLKKDPELDSLRGEERYRKLIARLEAK